MGTSEPLGGCARCPNRWGPDWVDTWVSDDVWARISPTGDSGGHLCFDCITKALNEQGLTDVAVELWGGPWRGAGHGFVDRWENRYKAGRKS